MTNLLETKPWIGFIAVLVLYGLAGGLDLEIRDVKVKDYYMNRFEYEVTQEQWWQEEDQDMEWIENETGQIEHTVSGREDTLESREYQQEKGC